MEWDRLTTCFRLFLESLSDCTIECWWVVPADVRSRIAVFVAEDVHRKNLAVFVAVKNSDRLTTCFRLFLESLSDCTIECWRVVPADVRSRIAVFVAEDVHRKNLLARRTAVFVAAKKDWHSAVAAAIADWKSHP